MKFIISEEQMGDGIPDFIEESEMKFKLGTLATTPAAMETAGNVQLSEMLARHASGDWGEMSEFDRAQNDEALTTGARLLSVYRTHEGEKVWVITEADRSVTTFLLPSEY